MFQRGTRQEPFPLREGRDARLHERGSIASSLGAALTDPKVAQFDRAVTRADDRSRRAVCPASRRWIYLGGAHAHLRQALHGGRGSAREWGWALAPDEVTGNAYLAWAYFGLKDVAKLKAQGARRAHAWLRGPDVSQEPERGRERSRRSVDRGELVDIIEKGVTAIGVSMVLVGIVVVSTAALLGCKGALRRVRSVRRRATS